MRACVLAIVVLAVANVEATVTVNKDESPVQQVVDLLRNLVAKVEADGKAEAESYDKFACFCKEQADEKQYHIEQAMKKISEEGATSQQLASVLTSNNRDIVQLNQKITDLTNTLKNEMELRGKQHAEYVSMDTEMSSAISDIRTAIDTLRDSRPSAMMQVQSVLEKHASLVPTEKKDLLKSFSMLSQPGKSAGYEFRSNDIIATLQGLAKDFVSNKEDLDHEEFETNAAYEHKKMSLEQRRDIARKEKLEKEQEVEKDTGAKEAADEVVTTQTDAKDADLKFIQELQVDCEAKAKDYDQRTNMRSNELVALNNAMNTLQTNVIPASFMQNSARALPKPKALSFLQARSRSEPMERVLQLISQDGSKLHSSVLLALASKIRLSKDHFVKVRQLVKDLINRLEQNAAFEQNVKSFCDKQMQKAINERDAKQMSVEEYIAKLRALEAQDKKLRADMASDNAAIAADERALQEATELRSGEHGENLETIETAKGGKEAVKYALSVLKEFYSGAKASFIQQPSQADRNGQTVDELAPTTFSGTYHGAQQSSQGIIGLLETILADFERTEGSTADSESDAQEEYNGQKDGILKDENDLNKELDFETARDRDVSNQIAETTDAERSAEQQLKDAIKAAGGVKELCADGAESYEDKKAAREKEIASLKEAIELLDSMAPDF